MSDDDKPAVNDVLAQQLGTAYAQVPAEVKQALQKDLSQQVSGNSDDEEMEIDIPSEGAVDDRNTSDGQLVGS